MRPFSKRLNRQTTDRLAQRRALLRTFARAWQRHDLEGVMACMTADCVYEASVGPEPGTTFRGADEVRSGILKMFAHDKGSQAHVSNLFIVGRHAAWEWAYLWRENNGKKRCVRGCDIFEFSGTKICRKSAFRKTSG